MSLQLDAKIAETGTRFRIFAQPRHLPSFSQPETIWVSPATQAIQAGPADDRMLVIDAINKLPFQAGETPPYNGLANAPVRSGPNGHFDHLLPGTREFSAAHMYAIVRRILDVWEDYFGHRIDWHFEDALERLLLIPLVRWDNAQSGFGFLEFGYARKSGTMLDLTKPYCENFDVLAHEFGHSIIFFQVGFPSNGSTATLHYGGFHESAGDLVSIISVLHFHSVVDHLLSHTRGNLFTVNELERVGELSESAEIRSALNGLRMSDVGSEAHDLSQPLTGAIFDILVEVFQKELVARHLISQELADRSFNEGNQAQDHVQIQAEFDRAYVGHEAEFKTTLLVARDYLGTLLATAWGQLSADFLTYAKVASALLAADRDLTGGQYQQTIRACFVWRQISQLSNPLVATPHRCLNR